MLSLHIERCIGSDRILFVITYRPEFEAPWIGQPHTSLMTLNRLAPVQSAALVAHASGGKHLPVELIERIAQRTDGVPLFIEELTKSIIESGDDNAPNSLAIPVTLQDALEARLDRLGEAREIAQIGALIGRSFDYELLTQVADSDDRAVRRYLDRLVDSGLVFRHGASPETAYTFKHALVQDTAYQSLLRSRRVELHAKVAQAIEERFSNQSVAEPELLAHHFEAAGQFEPALKYWQQAGEQAIQRTANAEAVAHLTTALELLTKLPSSPERVRKELELQIYLGSPLQALKGYGAPEVERAYNRARELSEQVGDVPLLAAAFRGSYVFHLMRGELATAHGYAGQLLELAESVEDPALLLEADFAYGQTLLFRAELVSAIKYLERGIKTYDPDLHGSHAFTYGQDPGVYCNVLAAYAYWLSGKPDTALDRARGAIRIAESISHPLSRAAAFAFNAMIHHFRREPDDCAALADAVIELSNEQQLPFFAAWGTILKGWADVERGILDTGTALVDDGISAWKVTAGDMHRPYFLGLLADIHAKSGNAEAGFALLEEACRISETNGENWSRAGLDIVEARLHAVMARGAESEAKYCEAMELARRHDSLSVELSAAIGLADLLARDGRTTKARGILVPVYDAFTEGFDTMDLKDAERLVAELS